MPRCRLRDSSVRTRSSETIFCALPTTPAARAVAYAAASGGLQPSGRSCWISDYVRTSFRWRRSFGGPGTPSNWSEEGGEATAAPARWLFLPWWAWPLRSSLRAPRGFENESSRASVERTETAGLGKRRQRERLQRAGPRPPRGRAPATSSARRRVGRCMRAPRSGVPRAPSAIAGDPDRSRLGGRR